MDYTTYRVAERLGRVNRRKRIFPGRRLVVFTRDRLGVKAVHSLLRKAKLEVESGYREQYTVELEKQTSVGVAVVVDMTVAGKRKITARKARRLKVSEPVAHGSTI